MAYNLTACDIEQTHQFSYFYLTKRTIIIGYFNFNYLLLIFFYLLLAIHLIEII